MPALASGMSTVAVTNISVDQMKTDLNALLNQRMDGAADGSSCGSLASAGKDHISTFARWLSQSKALENLLFWKEAEQYKGIFMPEDRVVSARHICELYVTSGATWQVNIRANLRSEIEVEVAAADPSEEVFDRAQHDIYELIRMELYPRYCEEVSDEDNHHGEEEAESLTNVLNGSHPKQARSFTRFSREQFCEEALLFWVDANNFSLLFQSVDLRNRAAAIFDTYMSAKAKARVNVPERMCTAVKAALSDGRVSNDLFLNAQKEVELFLKNDVFPRYQEWYAQGGTASADLVTPSTSVACASPSRPGALKESSHWTSRSSLLDSDRGSVRAALVELLSVPEELANLRIIARKREAEENLDFYLAAKEYTLLFSDQDRLDQAGHICREYLDPSSVRLVNLPNEMNERIRNMVMEEKRAPADLLEPAINEVLALISSNIYKEYLKEQQKLREASARMPIQRAAAVPKRTTSGCCVLM